MDKRLYDQINGLTERLGIPMQAATPDSSKRYWGEKDQNLAIKEYLERLGSDMHPELKSLYKKIEKACAHPDKRRKAYGAVNEFEALQEMAKAYANQIVFGKIEDGAEIKTSKLVNRAIESGSVILHEQKGYQSIDITGAFFTNPSSIKYHKSTVEAQQGSSGIHHETLTIVPETRIINTELGIAKKNDKGYAHTKIGAELHHTRGIQLSDIHGFGKDTDIASGTVMHSNKGVLSSDQHKGLMSSTILTGIVGGGVKESFGKKKNITCFLESQIGIGIAYTDTRGLITPYSSDNHTQFVENRRLEPIAQLKTEFGVMEEKHKLGISMASNQFFGLSAQSSDPSQKHSTAIFDVALSAFKTVDTAKMDIKAMVGTGFAWASLGQSHSASLAEPLEGFSPYVKITITPKSRGK